MSQSNQFRIGGVYRDQDDHLVRLCPHERYDFAMCMTLTEEGVEDGFDGECRLIDGVDPTGAYFDLRPGELHRVNGKWVPIEEKPAETAAEMHAESVRYALDLMIAATLKPAPKVVQSVTVYESNWGQTSAKQAIPATEKKYPRLTWADSKPVDRFPGFVVESRSYRFSEDDASRAPRHVTQSSPDLAGEWKPFEFGSAHLKG